MGQVLLEVKDACFSYPSFDQILDSVSFSVEQGELITLLGPNGAGKSTLLNCLTGLLQLDRGYIKLDGKDIRAIDPRTIAKNIAYVQQQIQVNFQYTVREYVVMGRAPHLMLHKKPSKADLRIVDNALERLGVSHLANRIYNQLSGGQRQMVDVARALTQNPKLILFDEPTSALDYGNQMKVLKMISELSNEGFSIIMTTHNPDHPILLGGNVCILTKDGRLVKGASNDIVNEQKLNEIYGIPLMIRYVPDAKRNVCVVPSF